ncbi:MAG: NADH-quinone oxidoreductase subunit C [Spirochaetales bacterium]|nr:NADH-quinone oxidoreductase subunit C [Spirochaetales bacterium]
MERIIENIKKQFPLQDVNSDHGWFITCEKKDVISLLTHLKITGGFTHLILITAVDWIEEDRFQLTYLLNNPQLKIRLGLRTFIERSVWPDESEMQSAHHLWPAVKTYQRELHEMFGIDFPGSPEVNDPLILEYWDDIPPYRRDFDTKKYSEETYFPREGRGSNDPAEYMKSQLYPNEGGKSQDFPQEISKKSSGEKNA